MYGYQYSIKERNVLWP